MNFIKNVRRVLMSCLGMVTLAVANAQTPALPTFSTDGNETWYYISFKNGGYCMQDGSSADKYIVSLVTKDLTNDAQLWALVGSQSNFQLKNKATGRYAVVSNVSDSPSNGGATNKTPIRTSTSQQSGGFSLVESTSSTYSPAWEIKVNTTTGLTQNRYYFNQWALQGEHIGLYEKGDNNNPVAFSIRTQPVDINTLIPEEPLTLWYTEPASDWQEYSLPIGNGQFGASLFGGVATDEIQFNEKTLWSGTKDDVSETGSTGTYGSYQDFGSVYIKNNGNTEYTEYVRTLDLTTATGTVSYTDGNGIAHKREYIASYPDGVVVTRLAADVPNSINITVTLVGGESLNVSTSYADGYAYFSGKLQTVSYNARVKVVQVGGSMTTNNSGITVQNATEVFVILGGGTDYDPTNSNYISNTSALASTIKDRVDAAAAKSWDELYSAHVADYQTYFNRMQLSFDGADNVLPTNQLVDAYNNTGCSAANARMLEQLYFAYGRYLEIASSRGVALPSNLQGIWSNTSSAAWNADIHANINVQMNYWPAEVTNLSEMHEPFLDYIINMHDSKEWTSYAHHTCSGRTNSSGSGSYDHRGWTCFTENNIFGGVGPWAHNYAVANAWYCTHLWQHYTYTLDELFLEKAFPAMLTATQFWLDRLVLAKDGTYECPNEQSPEHGPTSENGVAHAQQLVYDLFENTLKAVEVLGTKAGISDTDLTDLQTKFAKLDKGLAIETYTSSSGWGSNNLAYGSTILKEWKYSSFTAGTNGHRHVSHLMCLYPFNQVSSYDSDPTYFNAAINSLKQRGDASTGWSMGWKINLWARAMDGDHAHDILKLALRHAGSDGGIYYNLYDAHPPFQIDGNFGATAGIAEMLFQSHSDVLNILPALPSEWTGGTVSGLKGKGNFTVGFEWEDSKPTRITITNNKGQTCKVKSPRRAISEARVTVNGQRVTPTVANEVYTIPSGAGDEIVIDFVNTSVPEPEVGTISLNLTEITLTMSEVETAQLTATTNSDGAVTYVSSNTAVATVDNNGLVTAVTAGTATITANVAATEAYTAASVTCNVTVNAAPVVEQTITRSIVITEANKYSTCILPFNASIPSGVEAYECASVTDDYLYLTRVYSLAANTPYILYAPNGVNKVLEGVVVDETVDKVTKGLLTGFAFNDHSVSMGDGCYVLQNQGQGVMFYNAAGYTLTIPAGRCYLTVPGNKARALRIHREGDATDIEEVVEDAEVIIYDLTGRRVKEMHPGRVYIVNGKKIVY